MRIGVDGACLANGRGYGRFTRELLAELVSLASEHEFLLYGDRETLDRANVGLPNVRVVDVPQRIAPARAAAASGYRSPSDMLRLTRAVWRERPDVFWSPSVYTYFPLPPGLPVLVTVHDTITERFPELTMPSWRARMFWRAKVRLALWQSELVLTVSEFAAREIEMILGVARERLRVAGEAAAAAFHPATAAEARAAARSAGVPDGAPWFTYVGGFTPHKYVDRIVRAHAALVAEALHGGTVAPYLVLVGTLRDDNFHGVGAGIHEAITACGTGDYVRWTGFLPDDALRPLLAGTRALVLPSENEGFGLPAVEAAACGAPVIATTASPLPQLLEGGGVFVPPGDVDAVAAAMRIMLDTAERDRLGRTALACAGRLTWRSSARATLAALHDTMGRTRERVAPVPAVS
ncbi:MAG TPA: glycosyltransferase family 1 protein, partial [Gemmatimonadaceae bacterium]|jgi:glycosyltransferase involved in cell wall biosynthesis|nr:glycosyltransferase family 1 protein [Gemmatimonadaceae bacterium]